MLSGPGWILEQGLERIVVVVEEYGHSYRVIMSHYGRPSLTSIESMRIFRHGWVTLARKTVDETKMKKRSDVVSEIETEQSVPFPES